ncbi:PH domain-containing protein [Saccharopolyspora spinosa]|uniref:PH (Pleckstrin Homology) domain-containing protein n=1 Tax=Saccharopolyspora spinosa TaxID=60894 RepID=A0A2N3XSA8_SACSN|nr:PH domain-containing protein [Saccharopolyspora spinosa]PKW13501.1 PH (Pleckstrin Homology) domain-containing protein [Saccharopolyspora spinosa]
MDESGSRQWSTPVGLITCGWALAAAAAAWWLLAESPVDRLFIGVLVLALAATAAHGSICRPRLRADLDGVTVRGLRGPRHWPWPAVTIRVRHDRRFGRTVQALELDAEPELVVLTRLDLGADPQEVADELRALRC